MKTETTFAPEFRAKNEALHGRTPNTVDDVPYMVIDVHAETVRERVKYAPTYTSIILRLYLHFFVYKWKMDQVAAI